jgi:hypothetical protein
MHVLPSLEHELAAECPGYCGAQDTFYVGTLKGVGRVYQQTFIDTGITISPFGVRSVWGLDLATVDQALIGRLYRSSA